ncbi:MAG: acyl-CoA dehydrogenase family protein [Firmicutes bacterium]|nr:acyl-CoA dehydrogenase family protein [Bacillota bacterium]
MQFSLTPQQEAWREEVEAFLRENMTEELRQELWESGGIRRGPHEKAFRKKVAERGWNGLNWPRAYGGLEKSAIEQLILIDAFERAGAPMLDLTVTSLGPTIIRFGTEENKRKWLPPIIRGEVDFTLGYSEPNAGTDLANLQTRAVLEGEEWVINGQKIWNSEAHLTTHEWLAVRTDPDAPPHRGISVIIVPINAPGVTVNPLWTWGDVRTNLTFFENVRVPKENLIGEANQGWYYIMAALDFERVALGSTGSLRRLLDDLTAFCKETVLDGAVLAQRPEVQLKLAELEMDLEIGSLFGLRTASLIDAGKVPNAEASMQKVFTTELRTKLADWGMQILDMYGQLNKRDRWAPLRGRVEETYRQAPFLRFGGGTNEIQRNIIAQRGFGLPR